MELTIKQVLKITKNLGPYKSCIIMFFAQHENGDANGNTCSFSTKQLCNELNLSNKTIIKVIDELEEEGYITKVGRSKKYHLKNIFKVNCGTIYEKLLNEDKENFSFLIEYNNNL